MLSNQPSGVSHFGADPHDLATEEAPRGWVRWLPAAGWARVLALVVALAGIKVALLSLLAKRLFEIHWRVGGVETTWWSYVVFGVFVGLGSLSLWKLGRECQGLGTKTVRVVNTCAVVLGLLFIFLTFRTGQDTNYIMPVLGGILA